MSFKVIKVGKEKYGVSFLTNEEIYSILDPKKREWIEEVDKKGRLIVSNGNVYTVFYYHNKHVFAIIDQNGVFLDYIEENFNIFFVCHNLMFFQRFN